MAPERGFEDVQLPQSVDELRVFDSAPLHANRSIEAAEDLLECVVVAFAVSAGKIGVAACPRFEQRWIFNEDFISGVAVAHPKFIGTLLVPRDRRSCAADFNTEPVLAPCGNLAGADAAARVGAHAKQDRAEVFGIYGGFNIVFWTRELVGKGLDRVFRLLARRVKGLEISAERGNTQTSEVLGHIEPVRANIRHAS